MHCEPKEKHIFFCIWIIEWHSILYTRSWGVPVPVIHFYIPVILNRIKKTKFRSGPKNNGSFSSSFTNRTYGRNILRKPIWNLTELLKYICLLKPVMSSSLCCLLYPVGPPLLPSLQNCQRHLVPGTVFILVFSTFTGLSFYLHMVEQ